HGLIERVTDGEPVTAFHEASIERNDIDECADAELLERDLGKCSRLRPQQFWIKKQLAGIIAGLAVNIDGARVIRGAAIVEPEWIGEPCVWLGQRHNIAGTRMVEADLGALFANVDAIDFWENL